MLFRSFCLQLPIYILAQGQDWRGLALLNIHFVFIWNASLDPGQVVCMVCGVSKHLIVLLILSDWHSCTLSRSLSPASLHAMIGIYETLSLPICRSREGEIGWTECPGCRCDGGHLLTIGSGPNIFSLLPCSRDLSQTFITEINPTFIFLLSHYLTSACIVCLIYQSDIILQTYRIRLVTFYVVLGSTCLGPT